VKNRKIQPEAAFCPTKNQGLEWMNSNPRMQIAEKSSSSDHLATHRKRLGGQYKVARESA
ncbi:hypothetical protein, partial [Klebsiella pneumoniae]